MSAKCAKIITCRIATKQQTAGIKYTQRPKISIFAPQRQLIAPTQVKVGTAEGHIGLLGLAKIHANRCMGWECAPKTSLRRGKPFDWFLQFL